MDANLKQAATRNPDSDLDSRAAAIEEWRAARGARAQQEGRGYPLVRDVIGVEGPHLRVSDGPESEVVLRLPASALALPARASRASIGGYCFVADANGQTFWIHERSLVFGGRNRGEP